MKMGYFILVTGGARSGKSTYALERSEKISSKKCFVATCPVIDPEMDDRIHAHKLERQGRGWDSIEEEQDICSLLEKLEQYDVVLIDCLTLWVNNLMYQAEQSGLFYGEKEIRLQTDLLALAIEKYPGTIVCVTNEVGMGIVPDNAMARRYRDLVGSCNRYLAKKADEVILVSCGLALPLKTLSVQ